MLTRLISIELNKILHIPNVELVFPPLGPIFYLKMW